MGQTGMYLKGVAFTYKTTFYFKGNEHVSYITSKCMNNNFCISNFPQICQFS